MTNQDRIREVFTYGTLGVWYITAILSGSNIKTLFLCDISTITSLAKAIVVFGLFFQFAFFQTYTKKEVLIIIFVSSLLVLVTYYSSYNHMITWWMFVFASKNLDINKAVKIVYYILIIMMLLVFVLFLLGNITETSSYRNGFIRHSLGFSHPNYLGMQLFHLTACRYYIHSQEHRFSDFFFAIFAAAFAYYYPNTYTATIAILILTVFYLFFHLCKKNELVLISLSSFMIGLAMLCNAASVFFSIFYTKNHKYLKALDMLLSQRFSQCHRTFTYYGIPLLGQQVKFLISRGGIKYTMFFLDNGYMAILIRYGIIMYVVFSFFYLLTMIYLVKHQMYNVVLILACFSIYGVMENNLFSLAHNCFLLVFSYCIYNKIRSEMSVGITRKKIRFVFS